MIRPQARHTFCMATGFDKNKIVHSLVQNLQQSSSAEGAWLGGSTATGFEDDLSDTDIVIISTNPDEIFQTVEDTLKGIATITHIWKVEDSPWKNFAQKFYVLDQTSETYYLDIGVFQSLSSEDYAEHFNVERHGSPQVLFDKKDILKQASQQPRYESSKKIEWSQWIARFEILYRTFLKESLRGKYIDSYTFYQRLVMMWVQLVRRHRTPQKHDFGLRYLYRDLPPTESQYIEKLLQVPDLKSMQVAAAELRSKIQTLQKDVSV
ncbi:hypothetical protein AZI85_08140 [Bdellovibrio bacteriovorus]|uniref:Uncharacterized protein n=1 Tax=Bdellovibrio bacteriovorus TaxID=959 RepID=A0A150WGA8_BDEBC|nr:hypothetical protein [Bdellovibrio bacteriovorus]KYG62157.1 hypothetical protein AZI85_08140 [Bdellovibrio bacteriovorus]